MDNKNIRWYPCKHRIIDYISLILAIVLYGYFMWSAIYYSSIWLFLLTVLLILLASRDWIFPQPYGIDDKHLYFGYLFIHSRMPFSEIHELKASDDPQKLKMKYGKFSEVISMPAPKDREGFLNDNARIQQQYRTGLHSQEQYAT